MIGSIVFLTSMLCLCVVCAALPKLKGF